MRIEIPEKLGFLYEPARFKVAYGGRGSAKSWGFSKALLVKGVEKPLKILCAREFQSSIADSVHALLSQQIEYLGLSSFYEIQKATIIGKNGTDFIFAGLKHNVQKIKSTEGVDICWVEEAQTVSRNSWTTLIPTIRKENSEIWVSFNAELETDETYKRFVISPPTTSKCVVVKMNWTDNPWFPEVLKQEKDDLKARDYDAYLNVWEGYCRQTLEGAIYAIELREATADGRITKVPYNRAKPVSVFFDLGWADCTSLWFVQRIGFELRVIAAYQDRLQDLNHYMQYVQSRGYTYEQFYFPHDAKAKSLGTGMSIEEMAKNILGRDKVKIVPKLSVEDGINAVRTIFPTMWFDEENCADGLQALRRYRYDVDENGQFSRSPKHDDASHFADAMRYVAVTMTEKKPKPVVRTIEISRYGGGLGNGNWLGT